MISRRHIGDHHAQLRLTRFANPIEVCYCVAAPGGGFANIDHPLVQQVERKSDVPWRELSLLDHLYHMLVHGMMDNGTPAEQLADPERRTWLRRLGKMARTVDWDVAPSELRPPYHHLDAGGKIHQFSKEDLLALADIECPDDVEEDA